MRKRILSIMLTLCMVLCLMPTAAFAEGGVTLTGSGTAEDPYLIGTAEELKTFRDIVNGGSTDISAKLMNDIVLNDGMFDENGNWSEDGTPNKWTAISSYSGTFDGDGHTIRGLYVVRDKVGQQSYIGLFSSVRGGTVKNVAVTGYVAVSDGLPGTAGGIAGEVYGGTVESCVNLCHVVTDISSAGGITGIAIFSSTITNCANLGEISGTIDSAEQTGGVVGALWYDSTMTNCYNAGRVTNGGGIVGNADDDKVVNSYYLTGTAEKAAIKGNADNTAAAKSKSDFADSTVLELLKNNRTDSPWTKCGYLSAAGMTLPLLSWQTADSHDHNFEWKHTDTEHWKECGCGVIEANSTASHNEVTGNCTEGIKCECGYEMIAAKSGHNWTAWQRQTTSHTRTCNNPGCGVTQSDNCSGGTATCKEQATCEVCHEKYGNKDPNNHTDTTEWIQTETKHTQKYKCCGAVTVAEEDHEWENGVCSECGYGCRHDYEWQSENGEYWQKCKFCNHETAKKDIPTINISGSDKVCWTQDYKFSFTLPEGATDAAYGYEFIGLGDGPLTPTVENGLYSGIIKASTYPAKENSFKLIVSAKTADGFDFSAEKTVTIQNAHSGGTATCTNKAVCEICGESYGELNANNHSDLKHFPAVAATKTAEGNIEYWYCEGCGKYYKDAKATQEITKAQTVTAKLPDDSKSPQTGDNSNLALWIALLFISGGAVTVTTVYGRKKKRLTK